MVGVADLDRAVARYVALGFAVERGGRHVGRGTHNAVIVFEREYLELMAISDRASAAADPFATDLIRALDDRQELLLGFVLASDAIDEHAARLRAAGIAVDGPTAMSRRRPDGSLLAWRLLVPGTPGWRHTMPFLIEWDGSGVARPGVRHPNGARSIARLVVAASDVDATALQYERGLGLGGDRAYDLGRASLVLTDAVPPEEEGVVELTIARDPTGATLRFV